MDKKISKIINENWKTIFVVVVVFLIVPLLAIIAFNSSQNKQAPETGTTPTGQENSYLQSLNRKREFDACISRRQLTHWSTKQEHELEDIEYCNAITK